MREPMARNEEMEIDLLKLAGVYLKKWWLILICIVVGATGAFVYTRFFVTPMYQTSVSVYVNNSAGSQTVDYVTSSNLDASQKLVNTYISIVKSDRVLDLVAKELNGDYTTKQLREMLTAEQVTKTEIFWIKVTGPDPEEAVRVANTVAKVAPEEISGLVSGSSAHIIDYAKMPEKRFSPSYTKNTALGAMVGMVLALGYLTLAFLLDVRIRDDEGLTALFDLPILGQIPDMTTVSSKAKKAYGYDTEPYTGKKGGKR